MLFQSLPHTRGFYALNRNACPCSHIPDIQASNLSLYIRSLPLVIVQESTRRKYDHHVRHNEADEDTKVSPPMHPAHAHLSQELVTSIVCTELAFRRIAIDKIPTSTVAEKISHVACTRLADRSNEAIQLLRPALDLKARKLSGSHSSDKSGKWIEVVQPAAPELRD